MFLNNFDIIKNETLLIIISQLLQYAAHMLFRMLKSYTGMLYMTHSLVCFWIILNSQPTATTPTAATSDTATSAVALTSHTQKRHNTSGVQADQQSSKKRPKTSGIRADQLHSKKQPDTCGEGADTLLPKKRPSTSDAGAQEPPPKK